MFVEIAGDSWYVLESTEYAFIVVSVYIFNNTLSKLEVLFYKVRIERTYCYLSIAYNAFKFNKNVQVGLKTYYYS